MKKLFLLGFLILPAFINGAIINGIACIVEGECITSAEIHALQTQYSIPKKEALDLLIQDRLQKSATKDIAIDEKSIDNKISTIAAQNHITVSKMRKILKQQGTSWTKYRSSIKNSMKKEKFFQKNILNTIEEPNEDELKLYYSKNKAYFTVPNTFTLVEYSAKSEEKMKKFLHTKNAKKVKSHHIKKSTKNLNATLLNTILQTPKGSYTRIFNAGGKYISYKVLSKTGKVVMPFKKAKNVVIARWKQQQQNKAIKDYFNKLKTNANIQYIKR